MVHSQNLFTIDK